MFCVLQRSPFRLTRIIFILLPALLVARYLSKTKQGGMHPSEVSEDVGTALYGDLIGGTCYGYPMHSMTLHEKRHIAQVSKLFFQEAMDLSTNTTYTLESETNSWEEQFMIGKCCEKIASSLSEECLSGCGENGQAVVRSYETIMTDAIHHYSAALIDTRNSEQSSGGPVDKGGSSHGSLEVFYRLHACRFKVLLSALSRVNEERDLAEMEAYRIASTVWFNDGNKVSLPPSSGVREMTWDVFADCVEAMVQCRIDIPAFHRAAYRLAQAYLWAPAFHDPVSGFKEGVHFVPATKLQRIKGLNAGSPPSESASVVIDSLFDKRR